MVVDIPVLTDFVFSDFVRDAAIAYASATAVVGTSDEYARRCMQDIPHRTVYVGVDVEQMCIRDSLRVVGLLVVRQRILAPGLVQNRVCLLYTSRCV